MKDTSTRPQDTKVNPVDIYPGVAVDKADKDKVSKKAVTQETSILNDNPHTDGD